VFLPGYLSVLGCRVEALVAQMLLKHPEPISRIIDFHRINSESVSQLVGANVVCSAGFGVYQFWQAGFFSTLLHNLPGPVAVNAEEQRLSLFNNRTATPDIFFKHLQGITIDGQHPLAAVLLLLGLTLLYHTPKFRAENVTYTESRPTVHAG